MYGFIIPVPQKYEKQALLNIFSLRKKWGIQSAIEIWEVGSEISEKIRNQLNKIPNIVFKNVKDFCSNADHWKGFQIKAFAAYHSTLSEFILCDADIMFKQNPEIIFNDDRYKKTGAFFFRDLEWLYKDLTPDNSNKFNDLTSFIKRKNWILSMLPQLTPQFPKEWQYIYSPNTPSNPVLEAYMEAGVVYFNREKHKKTLEIVYKLNNDWKDTYQYIWGDKETWWLACCIAGTNYTMNSRIPTYPPLVHSYNQNPFFVQKPVGFYKNIFLIIKKILKSFRKK